MPWGLRKLLNWVDRRYGRPPIYVTENGWSTPGEESAAEGVVDDGRVLFYHNYTGEMQRAIYEDGVDVRGYFAWSLMDNFEWERGYSERFGLVYTDFVTQERHVKASGDWYSAAMAANEAVDPCPYLSTPAGRAAARCPEEASSAATPSCESQPAVSGTLDGSLGYLDGKFAPQSASPLVLTAIAFAAVACLIAVTLYRKRSSSGSLKLYRAPAASSALKPAEPNTAADGVSDDDLPLAPSATC